jgi:hypothetical protein
MTALGTYHGASVIMRNALDWNRSSISKFEFDAVPLIGFRMSRLALRQLCKLGASFQVRVEICVL